MARSEGLALAFKSALRFGGSFDTSPQILDTDTGFGRYGKQLVDFKPFFQSQQIARTLVAAETVDFGCDYGEVTPGCS
jgi:hypothetical protein